MKIEHHACRVAEIVLIGVCELVREMGQQVVDFDRPKRNDVSNGNVHAATKDHGERILGRSFIK